MNAYGAPQGQQQAYSAGPVDHLKPYTGRKGDRIYRCVALNLSPLPPTWFCL
jgi:hypothetical protein